MYKIPKDLKHRGPRTPRCPHPNCPANDDPWGDSLDPWEASQCTLNKPLMMVIPPQGVHLSCPVHPEGHHIYGSPITWMETPMMQQKPWCEYEHDQSKDLTYDSTRPYGTATGFTGNDTFKFSM